MKYRIAREADYLRAEFFSRNAPDDTLEFLGAVAQESTRQRCPHVLICVRSSASAALAIQRHEVLTYFNLLKFDPSHKIAIVGNPLELGMTHDHVEALSRRYGINVRTFQDETAALHWIKDRRLGSERRSTQRRQNLGYHPYLH